MFNNKKKRLRIGVYTVEAAIVIPIVILFFMASIEFTRISLLRHMANNASYEAARCVVVPGATVKEAQAEARKILAAAGVTHSTITVTPNPILESTSQVSVSVVIPAAGNLWIAPLFTENIVLSTNTALITERAPNLLIDSLPDSPTVLNPEPKPDPKPKPKPDPKPKPKPDPKPKPKPDPKPKPTPPPPRKFLLWQRCQRISLADRLGR